MKKIIATALVGAGAVLPLAGCGDGNDDNTDTTMQTSMEMPATTEMESEESTPTSVTSTDQLGTFDQAKLDAFVVAFRSGYSDLSEDRDDDSIENIVIASC